MGHITDYKGPVWALRIHIFCPESVFQISFQQNQCPLVRRRFFFQNRILYAKRTGLGFAYSRCEGIFISSPTSGGGSIKNLIMYAKRTVWCFSRFSSLREFTSLTILRTLCITRFISS